MKKYRSILVFRPVGLGDFVMSSPAFAMLRERYPDAQITLLTMHSGDRQQAAKVEKYAGGASKAPWVDLIVPHLVDRVLVVGDIRAPSEFFAARRAVQALRIDAAIQMFDVGTPYLRRAKKMLLVFLLAGLVPQFGWKGRGRIHPNRSGYKDLKLGHHVHGPLQFLKEMEGPSAYDDKDIHFDLRSGPDADAWAQQWVSIHGLNERKMVAVAPGSVHPHKSWPIGKFVRLCQTLLEADPQLALVVVGTAGDQGLAAELTALSPGRVFDTTGQTTVSQSAALLGRMALVVGNDGGAMHLADGMGAKVVSIVPGLEFPDSIEPWHNQDRAVRHSVECAPCYSFTYCPAGHNRCMVDLPVDRVVEQCMRAL